MQALLAAFRKGDRAGMEEVRKVVDDNDMDEMGGDSAWVGAEAM
jgi:hypothetical protein